MKNIPSTSGQDSASEVVPVLETASLATQVAGQLKRRRQWRQLSQRQLAERAGTHQATVARLESGAANPSLALVQRLFHELGYDVVLRSRPCVGPTVDSAVVMHKHK